MRNNAVTYLPVLLLCILFSLLIRNPRINTDVGFKLVITPKEAEDSYDLFPGLRKRRDSGNMVKEERLKPFISEYDIFRSNMTPHERILYVQRNYMMLDTEERQKRLHVEISRLNEALNGYERNVVFQNMKDTGFGNNLLALASSFLISRILNASFHVNWPAYVETFVSPLVSIPSNLTYGGPIDSYTQWKIRWSGCKPSYKELKQKSMESLVPERNLLITAYYDFTNRMIPSMRFDRQLEESGLVPPLNRSLITMNTPNHSSQSQISLNQNTLDIENSLNELHKTFYTEFSLMTAVRLFFKPDVLIQRSTEIILSKAEGFHLIGFQIRMGSGGSDFADSHTFLKMDSLQRFIDFAEAYRIQRGIDPSRVRWYVSTDSSKAERKLRELYPTRVLSGSSNRRGHSQQKSANLLEFRRAVVDLNVLSRCEYLVLTNYSSFGMIARMVSRRPLFSIVPARGY